MSSLASFWLMLIASFWISHSQQPGESDVFDTPAIMAGDVVIGGLFDIYYTKQRVNCDVSSVDVYSVMEMEAVKWALKRLNDIDFIPGVSLGILAYPTCGVPSLSALQANKFLQLLRENKTPNKTKKPVYIKAVIGPAFSSESEVVSRMLSSVPDEYQLLQMSYASTAAFLTDVEKTNLYPNFFRTIPSDQIQIESIVQLLVRLEWTYIGIFHSGDAYGKDAASELNEALAKKRICVAATYNCNNVHSKLRNHYHEILLNITVLKIKGIVLIGDAEMALAFIESIGTGSFIQYHPMPSIIFSESVGLQSQTFINSDSGQVFPASKGAFVLSPPHKEIREFSEHWNSLFFNESKYKEEVISNPWLEHMYIAKHKYSNAKTFLTKYPASTFLRYAVMATYSVAKIIKDVHYNICSGRRGLCSDMKENRGADVIATAARTVVDFEKDFDRKARLENITEQISFSNGGDVNFHKTDLLYEVYNFQASNKSLDFKFVKVASLKKIVSLVKDQTTEFSFSKDKVKFYNDRGMAIEEVKSVCQPNTTCTKCLLHQDNKTPLYIPGDLIVVVTFPIHDRSAEPLHCGPVRRSIGLDVALGAKFLIEKLNREKEIFPNKQIGLLLLDTCDDPLLTSDSILELHQLHGKLNDIVPGISDKILGYAGGFSSTPTLQVAEITTELKMVQVSCCATSDLLSDRLNYPYFVGLATPLNYTTQVMLKMVQKLGSTHIQVLFSDGKYGESAVRLIKNLAPSFNICVSQTVQVDYEDIGEWQHGRDDIYFEIERHGLKIYPSESICEDVIKSVQNSVIAKDNSNTMNLVKTILLSIFAGIILILLVAFICLCQRKSYHLSSMSSVTTTKSEYNSIDDLSFINMKRVSSDVSLKLSEIFHTDSPCGTPKSVRCMCDIKEHISQQRNEKLSASNRSSPIIPHFKNFPGSSLEIPSQRKILHQRLRSEPALKITSPSTTRRLNSEPLPPIPKLRTDSVDLPYILEHKSRRQHSEPTLPTANFNRLLFQNRNRKESLQDHGYISPITGSDGEDLPLHHFHESAHEQLDQTSKDNVLFVVGNPEEHVQVYSC
ncbi:uncharacterized protein LOC133194835 [Saccostrea echinata]|uniref:uncharacterized protein LOC133194835 n=1 Tax=Saccostrea echinata TaxID=191078 RepID=UPI002A84049A|nr:uncharacterized protein LOC133194835 [Saccostrea echinata]